MARARAVVNDGTIEVIEQLEDPDMGDLEVLADESRDWKWHVYRRKTQDEIQTNSRGQGEVYVTTVHGKVDFADFRQRWGGGDYRFKGYITGDRGCQKLIAMEIEGPHKFARPDPEPLAPAVAVNGSPLSRSDRIMLKMLRRLESLEQRVATPVVTAPAGLQLSDVKDILELSKSMQPPQVQPAPQSNTSFKEAMDAITLGANLKESLGLDGGEKSTTEIVIEKALPAVERLATAIMARRTGAPPPRPQAREVRVEEATPPAAAPTPTPEPNPAEDPNAEQAARWSTLISSLARAIADQRDPADFAATAEDILEPDEVKLLAMSSPGEVLSQLVAAAGGRFPVLLTTQAETYVTDVLSELKRVD